MFPPPPLSGINARVPLLWLYPCINQLPEQNSSLFFLLNSSFTAVWCNNLWKCKWKDVAGPAPGFEANSLMQSVTVNDCHPCRVHPMPCSQGDFTGMQRRTALARPHWPLVARQLPQRRGAVCFGSFRSHKWNRDPNQLESAWWEKKILTLAASSQLNYV